MVQCVTRVQQRIASHVCSSPQVTAVTCELTSSNCDNYSLKIRTGMRGVKCSDVERQGAKLINACVNVHKQLFAAEGQGCGDDGMAGSGN